MQINSQANLAASPTEAVALKGNEFRIDAVPPGSALLVGDVAVFNVAGSFCTTQAKCTHKQGLLNEGKLDGSTVTCPWHGSQFDVCSAPCCEARLSIQNLSRGCRRRNRAGRVGLVATRNGAAIRFNPAILRFRIRNLGPYDNDRVGAVPGNADASLHNVPESGFVTIVMVARKGCYDCFSVQFAQHQYGRTIATPVLRFSGCTITAVRAQLLNSRE